MISIQRISRSSLIILVTVAIIGSGCKEDENPVTDCVSGFDQEAMFNNLAYNLILPEYEIFKEKTDALLVSTQTFLESLEETSLVALQNNLIDAWLNWQTVGAYEFGPAESLFLRNSLNNFPVDAAEVDQIISSGEFDLDQPDRFDKGFPAIEYLLFGYADSATETVAAFQNQEHLRSYLLAIATDIQAKVSNTYDQWLNGYAQTFIENTGTAAGTSLSLYINNLNQFYEIIKRDQVGIPSGVLTLGFSNPEKVEAFYSKNSLAFAKAALNACLSFYKGESITQENGLGLDDYLNHVNAQKDGQALDQLIQDQFSNALAALAEIEGPLSDAVDTEPETVSNAYTELTRQVVHLKTDLSAVLCVSITYIDNPSDSD